METIEIFQVLGIEATKDEHAIKNAYRERLAVTNPEDNPEGFKRLRTAYEEACAYARHSEEEAAQERDTTPSGLWLEKAAGIYKNIVTRRDVHKWEELFQEDIFLSLEEEENCRRKLLGFLMDHFKLPTEVWKLLDAKLHIVSDAASLREHFPGDFVHYIVSKCERGEDVEFDQFEGDEEAEYDLYLQYYDRCYSALQAKQLDQAAEYIKNADGLSIFHPVMEVCRAHLMVEQQRLEEAVELMEKLRERFPKDAMVCYNAAEIMWHHDRKKRAAEIYQDLKKENDAHYMANVRLTEWYYENGQFEDAKKCAEKVLSSGADDEFMELLTKVNKEIEKGLEEHYRKEKDCHSALELGWCYLQDGKISKGIRIAESLEGKVPEERLSEYKGLLTKLYMEETEYEQAAAVSLHWHAALEKRLACGEAEEEKEKDLDRIRQYHLIRMQCFRAMGNMKTEFSEEECRKHYEDAIAEVEGLEKGTSQDIGLLLEKAQIYMEMGEYEKSLEIAGKLIEEYQVYAAYATELEVYRRQWNASGVVQSGRQCINYFPNYIRAYEHVAKVFLDLGRKEDLEQVLGEAKQNGIDSVILDAYRYQMTQKPPETKVLDQKLAEFRKEYFSQVEKGNKDSYQKGLPILTEYLYWYPGTYMLVERGLFHRAAHHYKEAKEDFEKALAENPRQPYALNGLSFVYKYLGDYEKALIYIKRAVRYRDPDMSDVIYADMANLYSLLGDYEKALKFYRKFAKGAGQKSQYHMTRYALCMARCGEVEQAASVLNSVYSNEKLRRFDEVVNLYQICGKGEKAEKLLEEWKKELDQFGDNAVKLWGNEPFANYYIRLAWQDVLFGDGKQAVACYEKAIKYRDSNGTLCDAEFISILCGNEKKGREYATRLRLNQAKAESEGKDEYVNEEKLRAQMEFLSVYYKEPVDCERMEKLLERGERSEICHFCNYCICKEMEAVRILWMIRMGRKEEALKRVEQNLEIQPLDEYMMAIRHMCQERAVTVSDQKDGQAQVSVSDSDDTKKQATGIMSKLKGLFGKDKRN